MRFKRKRYRRRSKRGRGIPYVYQNRACLGKKPKQVGRGAVSKNLGQILETVGTIIGL